MKVEHKLSPAVQAFAAETVKQLNENRREYLAALGMAKEIETKSALLQQALSQQLQIVQEAEGLPRPITSYQLSADCSHLVGEIPDSPEPAAIDRDRMNGNV